ncbi:hypothetical protein ACFL6Y_06305 [Elusimicrobiota bacterium]
MIIKSVKIALCIVPLLAIHALDLRCETREAAVIAYVTTPNSANPIAKAYLGSQFNKKYANRQYVLRGNDKYRLEFMLALAQALEENDVVDAYHLSHTIFYEDDIQTWKEWVYKKFGIYLEPETRYLGFPAPDEFKYKNSGMVFAFTGDLLHSEKVELLEMANGIIEIIEKNRHKLRFMYSSGCGDKIGADLMLSMGFKSYVSHEGRSASPFFIKPFLKTWFSGKYLSEAVEFGNNTMLVQYSPLYYSGIGLIDPDLTPEATMAILYGKDITTYYSY